MPKLSDAQYLDYVLSQPAPAYVPCERCGVVRVRKGGENGVARFCNSCVQIGHGAGVLEVDEPTPCYQSQDFWSLEGYAEDGLAVGGPGSHSRDNLVREIEQAANKGFCGACPIKEECLAWGQEEGYMGIAGGHWLNGGKLHEFRPPRSKSPGIEAEEKYAELEARGEPLPECGCHGEQMRWRKKPWGGSWVCMVKERERGLRQKSKREKIAA